jgi:tryptophanyl-tRNA synthetase
MAGDILLYHADRVPVGDDQRQHVELARDLAQRFNHRYGEYLTVPEAVIPSVGGRVMDLQLPTAKMSTTNGTPQGTVLVADPAEVVAKKVMSAVTDSGREVRRDEGKEGIANLIEIMAIATDRTPDAVEAAYDGAGYGQFKRDVADAVVEYLRPVRERYTELIADPGELGRTLEAGARAARSVAAPTLAEIKRRMGFG